jgi:hypothetical protein
MTANIEEALDELLRLGLDDWIQTWEVASIAKFKCGARTSDERRTTSIGLIRRALMDELLIAGEVTPDGFHKWALTPELAVARIEREWSELGREPTLGDICWFDITQAGMAAAKRSRTDPHG